MDRLAVLKRRLGLTDGQKDELLCDLLTDAELYVIAYTGRAEIPAPLEGTLVELAAIQYNRLGLEGESGHTEGGLTLSIDSLPESIRQVLNRHRLARVVGGCR
jgi:hypothetical protein